MWNKKSYEKYLNDLLILKDEEYLKFTKKITRSDIEMIGIRVPLLRSKAKEIVKTDIESFISNYQGKYFEEIMILGFVIGYSNKLDVYQKYIPFYAEKIVDWSTCDSGASTFKLIKKYKNEFLPLIDDLIKTKEEFKVRLAIVILMDNYITEDYVDKVLERIISIKSEYYYVNMALSWTLSECYIKFKETTNKYLNTKYLSKEVLNKAISKICDSYRISKTEKEELKKRRVK